MTRLRALNGLIVGGFLFIFLSLFYLQIIKYDRYQQLNQANRIRILSQPSIRGCILDANGNLLAGNILSYNLLIMNENRDLPKERISRLSSILSIPEEQLKSKYKQAYKFPFIPVLLCEDISLSQAVAIGQLKYDLPGVIIQANPKRMYPLGSGASHILGYLSQIDVWRLERLKEYGYKIQDLVGYSGVEEIYDYLLRSQEGGMQVEVDCKGRLSRILGFKVSQKGKDIQLTIDLRIQKIIHNNLKGYTGCVIVLNPTNGDILGLVSFPDFDPQIFQEKSSDLLDTLLNDPDAPLFNRAISGVYPPGSVFKIVVAAAGLEEKKAGAHTKFFCPGKIQIGNRKFSCWKSHGEQDILDALAQSCNIFFYNLGLRVGPQLINEYALKFGLNQLTGIDLTAESTGNLPYSLWQRIKMHRRWFAGDTANISIGQGDTLVTPLQIARIMASIANDGRLIKPGLLKSIREGREVIDLPSRKAVNLPISKETLRMIRKGLAGAVNKPAGTANILANIGISVVGKTGTAQVGSGQAHGWFVGYFPAEEPKYVICVFLEHVGTGYYSCMITKSIIEQMFKEGLL